MSPEAERSWQARRAAERALVRVVHHYGATPEFVLLGGLVPELLCRDSGMRHAGTTDIDVQVDLEVATGAVNGGRLERALRNAEFSPDRERPWRWTARDDELGAVIKFELLCDLPDQPASATVRFDAASALGAANLRGTGAAARDVELHTLHTRIGGVEMSAKVRVTGTAGFLMAKAAAAHHRQFRRDWYDIAFVLLHGRLGSMEAASRVTSCFGGPLPGNMVTALRELAANFHAPGDQGPSAYAAQIVIDHPELSEDRAAADAVVAVQAFCDALVH